MSDARTVFIAGSGTIGPAAAFLLLSIDTPSTRGCRVILGDRDEAAARRARARVLGPEAGDRPGAAERLETVRMGDRPGDTESLDGLAAAYDRADVIVDCLPGRFSAEMAQVARDRGLAYVNVTEYVEETEAIRKLAAGSSQPFILQTGLAPGYIDVLGCRLVEVFEGRYEGGTVESLALRVGALTPHAAPPSYYNFTWSKVGVATEYVKPATALRGGRECSLPSLSERERVVIDGRTYEEDLTSGGVADLCEHFAGRIQRLDYKTLRYPGHYAWVEDLLAGAPAGERERIDHLERRMIEAVDETTDDLVVVHARLSGLDAQGGRRQLAVAKHIRPAKIEGRTLSAIQATTASSVAESVGLALGGGLRGVVLQSQLSPASFLGGPFVEAAYGPCAIPGDSR